jgi:hypothetical protein
VSQRGPRLGDLAALGITNQRETTVLWNSKTGIRPDTGRYLYGGGDPVESPPPMRRSREYLVRVAGA